MNKQLCRFASPVVGVLLATFTLPGCTVIGAGVGAVIRTPARDPRPGLPAEFIRMKKGDVVLLRFRDGRTLSGTFDTLRSRPPSEYEPLYAAFQKSSAEGGQLPDLGPIQLLFGDRSEGEKFELVGLEEAGIVVRGRGGENSLVRFMRIRSLTSGARAIEVRTLERLVVSGAVPSPTEVRLKGVMEGIGLNEVSSLEYRPRRGHVLIGAAAGFVLDLISFAVLIYESTLW